MSLHSTRYIHVSQDILKIYFASWHKNYHQPFLIWNVCVCYTVYFKDFLQLWMFLSSGSVFKSHPMKSPGCNSVMSIPNCTVSTLQWSVLRNQCWFLSGIGWAFKGHISSEVWVIQSLQQFGSGLLFYFAACLRVRVCFSPRKNTRLQRLSAIRFSFPYKPTADANFGPATPIRHRGEKRECGCRRGGKKLKMTGGEGKLWKWVTDYVHLKILGRVSLMPEWKSPDLCRPWCDKNK